jgi:hypothetical protein
LTERATGINNTNSTGSPGCKTVSEIGTVTQGAGSNPAPFKMRRRIGSTAYEVSVYFKAGSGETMDDKILRLARGGVVKSDTEGRK